MASAISHGFGVALAKLRRRVESRIALTRATAKAQRIFRGRRMVPRGNPNIFRRGIDPEHFIARENDGAIHRQWRNARYPT
jgi:hypothetical protein